MLTPCCVLLWAEKACSCSMGAHTMPTLLPLTRRTPSGAGLHMHTPPQQQLREHRVRHLLNDRCIVILSMHSGVSMLLAVSDPTLERNSAS